MISHGKIADYQDAVNKIVSGRFNLFNVDTGFLVFPDLVEYDEEYENLFQVGSGECMYGFMTCCIPEKEASALISSRGSLEEFARSTIPAPGTLAHDRIDFTDVCSKDDVENFIRDIFKEKPDGWIYEEYL